MRQARRLRIHCWGGLGSQLFAWAVVEELHLNNFQRKIELILHTSGVTERYSELEKLEKYVQITQIQDFRTPVKAEGGSSQHGLLNFAKSFARKTLYSIGIFSDFNDRKMPLPWTFALRGHYSHRLISRDTVIAMWQRFYDEGLLCDSLKPKIDGISIHYRLGDLINLDEKTYLPPEGVVLALSHIRDAKNPQVQVYSDTPEMAVELLNSRCDWNSFQGKSLSPWMTISELLQYRHFIGTNSKISIWVALFRFYGTNYGKTLVPIQLANGISHNLGARLKHSEIDFY
jgi:hypothetical protein